VPNSTAPASAVRVGVGVEIVGDLADSERIVSSRRRHRRGIADGPCAPRLPSRSFIVSRVVVKLPGAPGCCNGDGAGGQTEFVTMSARGGDDLGRVTFAVAGESLVQGLASLPHFHAVTPPGLTALTPRPWPTDVPRRDVAGALQFAGLDQVEQDLVFAISTQQDLSTIGVSRSSRACGGADKIGRRPR